MCDTMVALGPATRGGITLFAKNSDREPDETQNVVVAPRKRRETQGSVRCTWVTVPQVEETARVLLCQPFWMYGAEMGMNDRGVVIGNEALFTREKPAERGLTGMDLLRLSLERSEDARHARDIIIDLLETYGQGGNCGYRKPFYYMNSFLIADAGEAYVLETVHSWWAWKKIETTWAISNIISLERDFDDCSPGLIRNALEKGWCRSESAFNFRECYSDRLITWGSAARSREKRFRELLKEGEGDLTERDCMAMLRDHGETKPFHPARHGSTICMHAADGVIRRSQTVGSMVAALGRDGETRCYVTGASNPCLSPFFPVFGEGEGMPGAYRPGDGWFSDASWWWRCEALHRTAMRRWPHSFEAMVPLIEAHESTMIESVTGPGTGVPGADVMARCFEAAHGVLSEWEETLAALPETRRHYFYRLYWDGYDRRNGTGGPEPR